MRAAFAKKKKKKKSWIYVDLLKECAFGISE
jgi:hypothetical protein